MASHSFRVNRQSITTEAPGDMPLLWFLRDELGLCGTKYGCGKGLCGACTVHLNGQAIRSCQMPIAALNGHEVTTIEGLAPAVDKLHPVQAAWVEGDVPQCGYCQPGQVMQAAALLAVNPAPTRQEIVDAMAGNICRCGTYPRIVGAIEACAAKGRALPVIGQAKPQSAEATRTSP